MCGDLYGSGLAALNMTTALGLAVPYARGIMSPRFYKFVYHFGLLEGPSSASCIFRRATVISCNFWHSQQSYRRGSESLSSLRMYLAQYSCRTTAESEMR
jgi:hypothetical protein